MMDYLKDFFSGMLEPIKMVKIEIMDCVEILIIAILIYNIIKWMKNTRAWVLMKGVVVLFVFYMIAALLNFDVILWKWVDIPKRYRGIHHGCYHSVPAGTEKSVRAAR